MIITNHPATPLRLPGPGEAPAPGRSASGDAGAAGGLPRGRALALRRARTAGAETPRWGPSQKGRGS